MSEGNYWAILTAPLLESDAVSAGAKLFYAHISRYTNKLGYCWASNERLATELQLSERTISRYVADLDAAGFITSEVVGVSDGDRRKERRIRLAVPLPFDVAKNGEIDVAKNGENVYMLNNNNTPHIPPQKKKKGRKPRPTEGVRASNPERFLRFWDFYRLRFCKPVGSARAGERGKAAKAWDKCALDAAKIDLLSLKLAALMKTEDWKRGIGIPAASTLLNRIGRGEFSLDDLPEADSEPEAAPTPPARRYIGTRVVDGREVDVYGPA